jgi:two-component system, cell cycle sensor histidine kinase and response regulator CckA
MKMSKRSTHSGSLSLYRNAAAAALIWTLLTGGSLLWDVYQERADMLELATNEAKATLNKDLAFRQWATDHGGVYVHPDERTPPNPYLSALPERDLETVSGESLTLMNPAYMVRQVMEEYDGLYGLKGRITSLRAINSENAPDEWEREALLAFELGDVEVSKVTEIGGTPYLRLMSPLTAEKGCLKCHAEQGYKEGDIRGGIGVSVPMTPYLSMLKRTTGTQSLTHGGIYVLGLLAMGSVLRSSKRRQTERSASDETLHRSEGKYRRLIESLERDYIMYSHNTDGVFTYVSPSVTPMLGYTPEEFLTHYSEFMTDSSVNEDVERLSALSGEGEKQPSYEVEIFDRNRNRRLLVVTEVPVLDERGGVIAVEGIAHDITDLREAENALRNSQKQYFEIFNSAADCMFIIDDEGKIVDVNSEACRTYGYQRDELIGQPVRSLVTPEYHDVFARYMDAMGEDGQFRGETIDIRKDGSQLHTEVKGTIIHMDGKTYRVAIVRDVTERRRLQSKLRQAQKMEAIGTLAGGIAHDFNNILSAILGYTGMALDDLPTGSDVHADIQKVLKAGHRAKDLVAQILTFSRQSEQELQPLRVQTVLREAMKLLRSSIPTTIEIKQDIKSECEAVLADPTQVHQIIMNLCTNAYHAMRETGGVLYVSLGQFELTTEDAIGRSGLQSGSYVKLEISDTGHGMTKDVLERAFEPYFSTKAKGEGTGLGLAMVHGIVKSFQGEITVYSEPGEGATFQIYLPIISEPTDAAQAEADGPLPKGNERILLVDDDEDLAQMLRMVFERLGYSVTALTSSVETLRTFEKDPDAFDLVITDMTMPKMTGAELAREILAIRPDAAVILCSGYSELISAEKAKAMGISNYVMKPVTKSELSRAVRKVLDAKREIP